MLLIVVLKGLTLKLTQRLAQLASKQRYALNKAKLKTYFKQYYKSHQCSRLAAFKEYYKTHRISHLAACKEYYKTYRISRLAAFKQYYQAHKQRIRTARLQYYGTHRSEEIAAARARNIKNAKAVLKRARRYYVSVDGLNFELCT